MKIKLLRGVVVAGFHGLKAGDVVDVDSGTAHDLVWDKCAVEVQWEGSDKVSDKVGDKEGIEVREPAVENRDPNSQEATGGKLPRKSSGRSRAT